MSADIIKSVYSSLLNWSTRCVGRKFIDFYNGSYQEGCKVFVLVADMASILMSLI